MVHLEELPRHIGSLPLLSPSGAVLVAGLRRLERRFRPPPPALPTTPAPPPRVTPLAEVHLPHRGWERPTRGAAECSDKTPPGSPFSGGTDRQTGPSPESTIKGDRCACATTMPAPADAASEQVQVRVRDARCSWVCRAARPSRSKKKNKKRAPRRASAGVDAAGGQTWVRVAPTSTDPGPSSSGKLVRHPRQTRPPPPIVRPVFGTPSESSTPPRTSAGRAPPAMRYRLKSTWCRPSNIGATPRSRRTLPSRASSPGLDGRSSTRCGWTARTGWFPVPWNPIPAARGNQGTFHLDAHYRDWGQPGADRRARRPDQGLVR